MSFNVAFSLGVPHCHSSWYCTRVVYVALLLVSGRQEEKDQQWKRAMDYLGAVTELNYMTQIVIMLYEDNNKVSLVPLRTRS